MTFHRIENNSKLVVIENKCHVKNNDQKTRKFEAYNKLLSIFVFLLSLFHDIYGIIYERETLLPFQHSVLNETI